MSAPTISLKYQGLSVSLEDQAGQGRGSLGQEDIASVQLPDGTYLSGDALTKKLEDPAFHAQVVGVIDAYGPVLSTPFHQDGKHEWRKIIHFWTNAQPDFWLRYITNNPAEADKKDFSIRQEFQRITRSKELPPAMQEAVAVQQMLGRIRQVYKSSLGLKRFESSVDQKTIDEKIIGPIVKQYPKAVLAFLQHKGQSPLSHAIMSTKAWVDSPMRNSLPTWARDIVDGKQVHWTLDEKGMAGLDELLKTPELIEQHFGRISFYCGWVGILSKEDLGETRHALLLQMIFRTIDVLEQQGTLFKDYLQELLSIFDEERAVAGLSAQDALRVLFKTEDHRWPKWGYWMFQHSRAESGMLAAVEARWRDGKDVAALAAALVEAYPKNLDTMRTYRGEYFLALALLVHNRLPTAEARESLGKVIVDLVEHQLSFNKFYGLAVWAQLLPPTDQLLEDLLRKHYGSDAAKGRAGIRYAQWMARQDLPDDISWSLELMEREDMAYVGDYDRDFRMMGHPWFEGLSPADATILTDQIHVWWYRNPERKGTGDIRLAVAFLYRLHNKLKDEADRTKVGDMILEWVSIPRFFALSYATASAHHLVEPTKSRLEKSLAKALDASDDHLKSEAELAHMLSRHELPLELLKALHLVNPRTLFFRFHSGIKNIEKYVRETTWFQRLSERDLEVLARHVVTWHQAREAGWTQDPHNPHLARAKWTIIGRQMRARLYLIAKIHNVARGQELRDRMAQVFARFGKDSGRYLTPLTIADDMALQEPARSALQRAFDELQAKPEMEHRRDVIQVREGMAEYFMHKALARGGVEERVRTFLVYTAASLASEELVKLAYPLLTAEKRATVDATMVASLTFADPEKTEWAEHQEQLRKAFQPIVDQVSPALRALLRGQ